MSLEECELLCQGVALDLRPFRLEVDLCCSRWPMTLLGPSGAGKSVLLRLLAGLARPQEGRISFLGEEWSGTPGKIFRPAHLRGIGYCRQETLLFPHMTVLQNVAYPVLQALAGGSAGRWFGGATRRAKGEAHERAREELAAWGVGSLAQARPDEISGGEQSRVALARAFAARPRLLLLDEPFASLDPPTQEQLVRAVQLRLRELGTPAVWVTHDRSEALTLGRTMAVIINGRIAQLETPERIFRLPSCPEVASFVGLGAALHGLVQARESGVMRIRCGPMLLRAAGNLIPGTAVVALIRSEDVELLPAEADVENQARPAGRTSARNDLPATVAALRPAGLNVMVDLDAGLPLVAAVTRPAAQDLELRPGLAVRARIKAVAVQVRTEAWGEEPLPAAASGDPAN
jgi:molybdate transport system ATP-binding protein